jgi:2-alkenal reductase
MVLLLTMGCGLCSLTGIRPPTRPDTQVALELIATPTYTPIITASPDLASERDKEEESLIAVYKRVNPSVVSIQVIREAQALFPEGQSTDNKYQRGQGSGFIVDGENGFIVTNNHVVESAQVVEVVLHNGHILTAEVLGQDSDSDMAVLRIDAEGRELQAVILGDSDALQVGQRALAIGNPFGWEGTLTTGIISGVGRTLRLGHVSERVSGRFSIPEMIQTDAAINFGNSGGPLLDSSGRVIGMNTAITSPQGTSSGVGFAVPINTIKRVLPDLLEKGHHDYAWLGIIGGDLRPIHVSSMHLHTEQGAIIGTVVPGGPAAKAGLKGADATVDYFGQEVQIGGDVIIAIDQEPVRQFDDLLVYLMRAKQPGDVALLTIIREDQEKRISVTLGARPGD